MTITHIGPDEVDGARLVVAGYTGANQDEVRKHVDELAALGIAPPPDVPMFYPLDGDLLTFEHVVEVDGPETSGEVEPVLIVRGDDVLLTLGSDHTDRRIETVSVPDSKAACVKPLADQAIATSLDEIARLWAGITVTCRVDGQEYQSGTLDALLPLPRVLQTMRARGITDTDVVVLGGTLPLIGGSFVHGHRWEMDMVVGDTTLSLKYQVQVRETADAHRTIGASA